MSEREGDNMTCETCTYRFECEHADRYYIPGGGCSENFGCFVAPLVGSDNRNVGVLSTSDEKAIRGREMNTVSLEEIQAAKKALIEAQQALDYVDEDFIETAIYQQKMAEARFNALLKRLKKESRNNIVQFPMQLKEEDKEAQPVWFDGLGWLVILFAAAAGIMTLIAQTGIGQGW